MNEKTTELIEQLAQKLGTTTEYLWGVLINQASISAITDLIYIVMSVVVGVVLFKLHRRFSKEDEKGNCVYEEDFFIGAMMFLTAIWGIVFLVSIFSIGNIINGFFNPEYWALNKVLNLI